MRMWNRGRGERRSAWLLIALMACASGCVHSDDKLDDSGDTGTGCPHDIESFCAFEFGGACPTYEEAAAMTCDGYHFDPTGSAGPAPVATDGYPECPAPKVGCGVYYDINLRTLLFFESMGPGTVYMVDLIWTEEPVCNINGVLGDNIDC
ncbi:MAG: hypothetical protein Q8P18_16770 [Pseudomonadota bacterium]|nr:hypothetical protein [Pseudomonadota bacterium]